MRGESEDRGCRKDLSSVLICNIWGQKFLATTATARRYLLTGPEGIKLRDVVSRGETTRTEDAMK